MGAAKRRQNRAWLDQLPGHRTNHTLAAPPEVNVRSATSGGVNPTLGMTQEPSVRLATTPHSAYDHAVNSDSSRLRG